MVDDLGVMLTVPKLDGGSKDPAEYDPTSADELAAVFEVDDVDA